MNPWIAIGTQFGLPVALIAMFLWRGLPWLAKYLERQERRLDAALQAHMQLSNRVTQEFLVSINQSNERNSEVARQLARLTAGLKDRDKRTL